MDREPLVNTPAAVLSRAIEQRYRIENEIGAGGMATVFRAHDIKHNRHVAIKLLHPQLSALLGGERFLAEIQTTAALQHPHILPLFDSGEAKGLLYYVMPLVEGETLRNRLAREHQLSVADAVRIASAVASALDYAHRHGVIHRDIKPENILLHEGNAIVADFGIALAVENAGGERMTQTGLSMGTPRYMSPEQAMAEKNVTARSDVYSLGVVTYEMLVGEPPFTGATAQMIVARVLSGEARSIVAQRKNVPLAIEAAVFTALEKLPADRFATADAFGRALVEGAQGTTGSIRIDTGSALRAQRQRYSWMGALAVVAGVAGILVGMNLKNIRQAPLVTLRFPIPLPRDVSSAGDQMAGSNIAIAPNGESVVFAGIASDGRQWLYARGLNELTPHLIADTEGAVQPFFSPNGAWIGFWSAGQMRKISVDGGKSQPIADMPVAYAGATWTAKDVIVFNNGAALYAVSSGGGEQRLVATPDTSVGETHLIYPVALSDGDHVLYRSVRQRGDNAQIGLASVSRQSGQSLGIAGTFPLGSIAGHIIYSSSNNSLQALPVDVSTARVLGSPITVLTDVDLGAGGAARAALSLSGALVYRGGARDSRLVWADGRSPPLPVTPEIRVYLYPRISPDGNRIAFSIDAGIRSDVWIYDQKSHVSTRLSETGLTNDRAEWTPDGSRIVYRSDERSRSAIWWRAADISGPATPILLHPTGAIFEGVITPNGQSIVYQLQDAGQNIWVRALKGDTTPFMISPSGSSDAQARISPDGRWVAYVTTSAASSQVVVQPFPGPGARVQVSLHGGTEPVWARDGHRLFYRGNRKFMVATVSADAVFRVRNREIVFDDTYVPAVAPHANYDVSLDGKRLLVVEAMEHSQLIYVQNWRKEVETRLRAKVPGHPARVLP